MPCSKLQNNPLELGFLFQYGDEQITALIVNPGLVDFS